MKTFDVYYEESFGKWYQVEAENFNKAEDALFDLISEGKADGPDECVGSITVCPIGDGDPKYQVMGAKIDALSDYEKKFYFWNLLRFWYKNQLYESKAKYINDRFSLDQINRLIANVEEIDTLLTYDLF